MPNQATWARENRSNLAQAIRVADEQFAVPRDSPGCAVGIMQGEGLVWSKGYGLADVARRQPNTPKTRFEIASNSKQFTALLVQQLAAENKLDLDASIRNYLSELDESYAPITVRHLIHHVSGVRDYMALMNLRGQTYEEGAYDNAQAIAILALQQGLEFEPGTRFEYSNSGYLLLAELVQRIDGRPFSQAAHSRIFAPLGMARSYFKAEGGAEITGGAMGYRPLDEGGWQADRTQVDVIGDGGMVTSVTDLLPYHRALLAGLRGTAGTGGRRSPITGEIAQAMLASTPLRSGELAQFDVFAMPLNYASGIMTGTIGGSRVLLHGGSWMSFRSQILMFPEQRTSLVALCNRGDFPPLEALLLVAERYFQSDFALDQDRADVPEAESFSPPEKVVPSVDNRPRALLKFFIGRYRAPELATELELIEDAGAIHLCAKGVRNPIKSVEIDAIAPLDDLALRLGRDVSFVVRWNSEAQPRVYLDTDGVSGLMLERLGPVDRRGNSCK